MASVLGITYDDAKKRLEFYKGREIDAARRGLALGSIIKVLKDSGVTVSKVREGKRWPAGTIVFLFREWGRYEGSGHYLLKVGKGWMDPWPNSPMKIFPARGSCAAYLQILVSNWRLSHAKIDH